MVAPFFSQNRSTRDAFSYHIRKTERPIKIDGIISNVVEHVMTHEIGHSVDCDTPTILTDQYLAAKAVTKEMEA